MQEKVLSTLVTEALKPASSFIDALLGPRLERIRTSAKKRELRERLEDPRINDLLQEYFRRLISRVSEIKTLVFPEQVIPLTSIYEPLSLTIMAGKNFRVKSALEIVRLGAKDLKSRQNYLIIDSAGMGKSTFSKFLVLDIFESTIKIPLFLELRRIDDSESLLGRLAKELDPDQNDIDDKFLALLLKQGEYIIVLDGYDELSENARKKISPQITELALDCEKNTIILTSRPEVGLPEIPRSIVYNIQPLERKQAESLVLRYDNFAKVNVGERLISQFDKVSEEFLKTPLLLVLLYKTYGYNQSIATNVTSFYDDVYNAFYKGHDLSKAGFSRAKLSGLDQENFRRLLRGFSFLLLTAGKSSLKSRVEGHEIIENAVNLTLVKPSSTFNFFEDLLISVPFLVSDGGEYRFIHKSIVEFFAAEYLASASDAEKTIKIIHQGRLSRTFNQPLNYLLQLNPSLFRRAILAPAAKAYLDTRKLTSDPLMRTLYFCGVTHFGVTGYPAGPGTEGNYYLELVENPPKRLAFRAEEEDIRRYPSETWSFLSDETTAKDVFLLDIVAEHKEELNQLLTMKRFVSVTSKTSLKYSKNELFRNFAAVLLGYFQDSKNPTYWILSDKACKAVLKTIQKERKAQNQLDAVILRSS